MAKSVLHASRKSALVLLASCALACGASHGDSNGVAGAASPTDPGSTDGTGAASSSSGAGGSSSGGADAGLPKGPDAIELVVEPSDHAAALLAAIQKAKTSIHVTMYLLGDQRFVNALIAQHHAGLDVKVILNHTFQNGAGTNAAVFSQLQAAGVSVAWSPAGFTLTHEKCVIVDGAVAWIMTMNLESSSSSNREFLALDGDPADVKEAEALFAADFADQAYTPQGNLLVAPVNARAKIVALIQSATKTIDVEGEELSDYMVVNALVAAKHAGVAVRVVISNAPATAAQQTAKQQLTAAQIPVMTVATPYIHAKSLVADGARAYVGSANFTTGSFQYNRELGIITNNATTAATVAKTIGADFATGS